jgi:hypothetical protein
MATEPHEGIDPYNNKESRAVEHEQTPLLARAGGSGAVPTGGAPGDEQPSQAVAGGVADGSPVGGVTISDADLEESVPGDTGPEHHGQRRG